MLEIYAIDSFWKSPVSKSPKIARNCKKLPLFQMLKNICNISTDKSFSEDLILASINPLYDKRLFIELRVQCMKIPNSEHIVYINGSKYQNKNKMFCVHNMF